jgi:hypothetical protein
MVMARIAIATLQNGWDCRWIRPNEDTGPAAPEGELAVCARTGVQRRVSLAECERCVHWELAPDVPETVAAAPATASLHEPLPLTQSPSLAVARPERPALLVRGLYLATWVTILAGAATLIASGLVILTTPLAIPVTVGLFLCAAALVGFACTGQMPRP